MKVQGKFKMQAHINSSVVMDVAAFKVCHSSDNNATTTSCLSSCNVQPNQLNGSAILYVKDPPPSIEGFEHHSSRHLRFDRQGAVDADCRFVAHVAGKLVCARCQQDLVD